MEKSLHLMLKKNESKKEVVERRTKFKLAARKFKAKKMKLINNLQEKIRRRLKEKNNLREQMMLIESKSRYIERDYRQKINLLVKKLDWYRKMNISLQKKWNGINSK